MVDIKFTLHVGVIQTDSENKQITADVIKYTVWGLSTCFKID